MNRKGSQWRKAGNAPRAGQQASRRGAVSETTGAAERLLDRLILIGMLVFTFLACCYPLTDTDIWWHLRTGQLIWQRGEVPRTDWYTFTDAGRPWIDLHWGFQLFVTLLYSVGGVRLLVLAKALFLTLAVAVAWHAAGRRMPAWLKACCWLPPIINISGRGEVRPEFVSLAWLAVWLWVVMRLESRPRLVWVLPLVTVCWVNFHGLFALGLVVGAAYALDRAVRTLARSRCGLEPAPPGPTPRTLVWAGLLIAMACFANPYFARGAAFPLTLYQKFTVDQEFYAARVLEFVKPIDFVRQHGWRYVPLLSEIALWLATAGSFIWLAFARRWNVFRLTLFVLFSHLAWEAQRNTNVFSLVSGVLLCANIGDDLALRTTHGGLPAEFTSWRIWRWAGGVVVCGLILSVFTGDWARFMGEGKPLGLNEAEAWFAHGASRFAGRAGMPQRAYVAHFGQAAVYEFHNGPERKVFMDPRLEVMTQETFAAWEWIGKWIVAGDLQWQEVLRDEQGNLPAVVLDSRYSRDLIDGLYRTPGWRLVFADQAAALFLDDATAQRLELPAVSPDPLKYPPGMRPGK
jgi:hypothetical protein